MSRILATLIYSCVDPSSFNCVVATTVLCFCEIFYCLQMSTFECNDEIEGGRTGAPVCSHQDEARKTVSVTAHGVAYMRGMESILHPDNPLYYDPYALVLGGDIGKEWADNTAKKFNEAGKQTFIGSIAIRTKKIDDTLNQIIQNNNGIRQICTLGAGLDTRPWRMTLSSVPEQEMANFRYFEIDFREIFDFKIPTLEKEGACTRFAYSPVVADLTLPTWTIKLAEAGFDPSIPTIWLMEGLTGYLTQDENRAMFLSIREQSAPGSHVVATFITPDPGKKVGIALHRFMPEDPMSFVSSCGGWLGEAIDLADTIEAVSRRPQGENPLMGGYYLVVASV